MCWKDTYGVSLHRNTVVTDVRMWLDTFVFFAESELAPQTTAPILMGIPTDRTVEKYSQTRCILYNTEQLTRNFMASNILWTVDRLHPVEVWDYSKANIAILHDHGIPARHVPLRTPKWYQDELREYRNQGIFYDVGFSGLLTQRRNRILQDLEDAGFIVRIITMFGQDRDMELAKCKVILNIHAGSDYMIFESARCEPWLSIGVPVISETSLDDDPRCILTDYDSFVQTTVDTLRGLHGF